MQQLEESAHHVHEHGMIHTSFGKFQIPITEVIPRKTVQTLTNFAEAILLEPFCNFNNQALTHWSLAAIERQNPGTLPALFNPDGDPGETLELAETEGEMIDAIERLRQAVVSGFKGVVPLVDYLCAALELEF